MLNVVLRCMHVELVIIISFESCHDTCRVEVFSFIFTWQITTQLNTQLREGVSLPFAQFLLDMALGSHVESGVEMFSFLLA